MLYHGDVAENQGNNNVGGAGLEALYEPGVAMPGESGRSQRQGE